MKRLAALLAMLILGSPTLALAAEHSAGYRGIGMLYFTFMAAKSLWSGSICCYPRAKY